MTKSHHKDSVAGTDTVTDTVTGAVPDTALRSSPWTGTFQADAERVGGTSASVKSPMGPGLATADLGKAYGRSRTWRRVRVTNPKTRHGTRLSNENPQPERHGTIEMSRLQSRGPSFLRRLESTWIKTPSDKSFARSF